MDSKKMWFENIYEIQYNIWKVIRKLAILVSYSEIQDTLEFTLNLYKFLIITSNSCSARNIRY